MSWLPLIAPKPFVEYSPEEFHSYISGHYALRVKRGTKPRSPVAGISLSRSKAGKLTVRRNKERAFDYVTKTEVKQLAAHHKVGQADVWNAFKRRCFIIADDRLEAERIYADKKSIPW